MFNPLKPIDTNIHLYISRIENIADHYVIFDQPVPKNGFANFLLGISVLSIVNA
jgi:hypothetical protein